MAGFFSFVTEMPSLSAVLTAYASISAFMMVVRTVLNETIPESLKVYISSKLSEYSFFNFSNEFTFVVEERWEAVDSETYKAAKVYLPSIVGDSTNRLLVGSNDTHDSTSVPQLAVPSGAKITDNFQGMRLQWSLHTKEVLNYYRYEDYFHLTCKKTDRGRVLENYFPHVARQAQKILQKREILNIYTYDGKDSRWRSAIFKHSSTFYTLAMDPDLKQFIIDDLNMFVNRKGFFDKVGRAWKRGYLLYGPPGTGKSSLVAAIANHLRYHVYDLQLQSVKSDADLRNVLTRTANRSIILIEDIDCNWNMSNDRGRRSSNPDHKKNETDEEFLDPGATLSGILNFIDGLWSSCGEERIIIFTTNHKERLDPALLRPGRMDVHIEMRYCTPSGFRMMAKTYLGIEDHAMFGPVEELIKKVDISPAEMAQQLMKSDDATVALGSLIEFLDSKANKIMDGGEPTS